MLIFFHTLVLENSIAITRDQLFGKLVAVWHCKRKTHTNLPPAPPPTIERKKNLRLLGITFADSPTNWQTHMSKASSRLLLHPMFNTSAELTSYLVGHIKC